MYFKQVLDERYGCASYVVASRQSHEAAIVDPSLDVEPLEVHQERESGAPQRRNGGDRDAKKQARQSTRGPGDREGIRSAEGPGADRVSRTPLECRGSSGHRPPNVSHAEGALLRAQP